MDELDARRGRGRGCKSGKVEWREMQGGAGNRGSGVEHDETRTRLGLNRLVYLKMRGGRGLVLVPVRDAKRCEGGLLRAYAGVLGQLEPRPFLPGERREGWMNGESV